MPTSKLLIPVKRCARQSGGFRWPARPVLSSPHSVDVLPLRQLSEDLRRDHGIRSRIERNVFGVASLRIRRDVRVKGPEAYRMVISRGGVEVFAEGDPGAYYAIQTLRELLKLHGRSIPACTIEDRPDFPRRAVYYDCSRGKVPKLQAFKALVERLAHWKINELQIYVENVFTWKQHPAIGKGYSPFTPEEILALQDHCKEHHIRLVGSLASFGHMEKILSLPQYAHLAELPGYRGLPGGTTLYPGDPGSIKLMEQLFEEFIPLFEAEDFNICGDETWELGKGRSKRRADRVGVGRVYLEFLLKLHKLVEKHGKRTNAWADIVLKHPEILGEVPRDIVMLNWDYHPKGERIARTGEITRAGLPAMVCPGTNAWNSHGCRLKMGMLNIANFAAEGLRRKVEGVLNTDWGNGSHRNMLAVSLHNLAYGAAHSWNHRGVRDRNFTERFCTQTFGSIGSHLVKPIRTLGSANESLKLAYSNSIILYRTLIAPIKTFRDPDAWYAKILDAIRPSDLSKYAAKLSGLRWPSPKQAADQFNANALEEYALATKLELHSSHRAVLLRKLRAGKSPSSALLKKLTRDTAALIPELERVWPLNNKPSRLRDILKALRATMKENTKLLRR